MTKVISKARSKWESLNDGTQRLASIITAVIVIGGAFFGGVNYIVNKLDEHIQSQTSTLYSQMQEVKLSTTRNELILMMNNNPDNVLEIERLAKVYFVDMKGDFYMTGLYSNWCRQHNANCSFSNVE